VVQQSGEWIYLWIYPVDTSRQPIQKSIKGKGNCYFHLVIQFS
jgi:hypothetical protein